MYRVELVSAYIGTGKEGDAYRPAVGDAHKLAGWTDITGIASENILPDPNAMTLQAICDQATLDKMNADGVPILTVDEVVEDAEPNDELEASR